MHRIGGLPLSTAIFYGSVFAAAFWFYSLFWVQAPILTADSRGYLKAAQDMADFHIDQLQERTPGYPLLLVLTSSSQSPKRTLFFISLLLHFASIWLLAMVLYRAGLMEMPLLLFGSILLLPPFVEPAAYVLSESLTEFMLVVSFVSLVFWCFAKKRTWILLSALAMGCAALTRPTYQILAFVVAGYFFIMRSLLSWIDTQWRDVTKASLVVICGSVLTVGGYILLNYYSFGYLGLTPKLGLTLSQKTLRVIERLPDEHAEVRELLIKFRNAELLTGDAHTGADYIWYAIPELTKMTGFSYTELSEYMLQLNWLLIKQAPLNYLQESVWAFCSYWFPSSGQLANFDSRGVQLLWALGHFIIIGGFACTLVLLAGGATYIRSCKRILNRADARIVNRLNQIKVQGFIYGLGAVIIFYTAAISCLIEVGTARYRVPTDSLIVFMIFLGTYLWRRLLDLFSPFSVPKNGVS
jgi:hypothetical protein